MHIPLFICFTWIYLSEIAASSDGRCDPKMKNVTQCADYQPCCSESGYCGNGPLFCGGGCKLETSAKCFIKPKCQNMNVDFTQGNALVDLNDVRNNSHWDFFTIDSGAIVSQQDGISIQVVKSTDTTKDGRAFGKGVRLSSVMYLQYGRISANIKAAKGSGIITSFIFMSDEGDEIDFEIMGKNITRLESNYYYNGILDHSKGVVHDVNTDLSQNWNTYTIQWSPDSIKWFLNHELLRIVERSSTANNETGTEMFPSRPSRIQISIWDGGSSTSQGVRDWAGVTDWDSSNLYSAQFENVKIDCFSGVSIAGEPVFLQSSSAAQINDSSLIPSLLLWLIVLLQ